MKDLAEIVAGMLLGGWIVHLAWRSHWREARRRLHRDYEIARRYRS